MADYQKILPVPNDETQPFWDSLKQHKMKLPRCKNCSQYHMYPRSHCPNCFSWDIEWVEASGKGKLYTYAIQYRPQGPGFQDEVPYITALVQLDEGPRLMTNLVEVEADPAKLKCDSPVEIVYDDVTDEITLAKFRPV